jgi:hypothetical protein
VAGHSGWWMKALRTGYGPPPAWFSCAVSI